MDEQQEQDGLTSMRAITISREYGSGGGEIAKRVATRLGWQLIDHEIVLRVAQTLNISEVEAAAQDEYVESNITQMLASMSIFQTAMFAGVPPPMLADSASYRRALNAVVEAAVAKGNVVIVGRGAQAILARRRDTLHVRIVAPLELRIRYVMRREGRSREEAQSRIQLKESDRTRYLQTQYHCRPDDAHLYDVIINTGYLDLDSVVNIVCLALEHKSQRLKVPTGDLGPVTGLEPYPDQPGDIRPPTDTSQST